MGSDFFFCVGIFNGGYKEVIEFKGSIWIFIFEISVYLVRIYVEIFLDFLLDRFRIEVLFYSYYL